MNIINTPFGLRAKAGWNFIAENTYRYYAGVVQPVFRVEVYPPGCDAWGASIDSWLYDYYIEISKVDGRWLDPTPFPKEVSDQGIESMLRYAEAMWRMNV